MASEWKLWWLLRIHLYPWISFCLSMWLRTSWDLWATVQQRQRSLCLCGGCFWSTLWRLCSWVLWNLPRLPSLPRVLRRLGPHYWSANESDAPPCQQGQCHQSQWSQRTIQEVYWQHGEEHCWHQSRSEPKPSLTTSDRDPGAAATGHVGLIWCLNLYLGILNLKSNLVQTSVNFKIDSNSVVCKVSENLNHSLHQQEG